MHHVIHAVQMRRDLPQGVEHAEVHVGWDPRLWGTVGDVDVEAVEAGAWGEGAGEVEEPDSGDEGVWVRGRFWFFFFGVNGCVCMCVCDWYFGCQKGKIEDLPGTGTYIGDLEIWTCKRDVWVEEVAGAVFPKVVLEVQTVISVNRVEREALHAR